MGLTLTHDLVDLAILFPADEFLVLAGELKLDSDLVLGSSDKGHLGYDHQGGLDGIIRAGDGESQLVKRDIGIRICTDIGEQSAKLFW